MVELDAVELHNIELATLVFGVAGAALARTGISHATVKPSMLAQVAGDVFVAVYA